MGIYHVLQNGPVDPRRRRAGRSWIHSWIHGWAAEATGRWERALAPRRRNWREAARHEQAPWQTRRAQPWLLTNGLTAGAPPGHSFANLARLGSSWQRAQDEKTGCRGALGSDVATAGVKHRGRPGLGSAAAFVAGAVAPRGAAAAHGVRLSNHRSLP